MKKIFFCMLCLMAMSLQAVNYCANTSWGYAGNVTGGGNATPTIVNSESQLKNALKSSNKVIIITKNITLSGQISTDKSNLTIMALPGVKLVNNTQTQEGSGILYLKGSNLILRNLTFEGPGAYDCDGKDNLTLDGAKNVWVDHCDFQDGCDGNFDIKGNSDNITVSWCRFRYLKEPKAGGPGGADDHRFSNLVGSSSTDKPSDGTYNITYGFCWWDEGCKQRMTRCRNCLLHFLNCYWNSSVADYYVGPENASCYFEGCTFAGKANSAKNIYKGFNSTTNYCKFVNCSGKLPSNAGNVSAPSYSYDAMSASAAKTAVTNASCGAGATLTVTNGAEVSSSCGGDDPDPDPQPAVSDFWNISDDDFKDLGVITTEKTVRGLHIVATADKAVTVDESVQTVGDLQFTHRLKFGGSGNANYRHVWFDVTGNCSVTVWLTSSSGSGDARTLNIAGGSFGDIVSTMSAPVGSINEQTYQYTGGATRLYLYSANSGINLYGIQVAYPTPTDIENVETKNAARKVLRSGQVVICRDGKTFSVLGQSL